VSGKLRRSALHWRWLALIPVLAFIAIFVVVPNLELVLTSFWQSRSGSTIHNFTFANFRIVFGQHLFRSLIFKTLYTAVGAAAVAACLAYPLAYIISRHGGRWRLVLSLVAVAPLWVSFLIRVFSWKIILGQRGILNSLLTTAGILNQPYDKFLYSRFAVFLTFAYVGIPYVYITSFTALERIPRHLLEASSDCGGSAVQTFRSVTWPLSRRGLGIGFALAFVIAVGDYVTPSLVGGLEGTMVGGLVTAEFGLASNLPLGAALGLTILGMVFAVLFTIAATTRTRGVLE
jgi:spermidine/putrescine transport system permease protein